MTIAQEHAYLAFLHTAKATPTGGFYAVQPASSISMEDALNGRPGDLAGVYRWTGKQFKRAGRPNRNGYMRIPFRFRGRRYEIMEHWAVWLYCGGKWPPPGSKLQLNHKDLDRANNRLDNLELVTQSVNIRHARKARQMGKKAGKR